METDEEEYWKNEVVLSPTQAKRATPFASPSTKRPRTEPSISAPVRLHTSPNKDQRDFKGRSNASAVSSDSDESPNIHDITTEPMRNPKQAKAFPAASRHHPRARDTRPEPSISAPIKASARKASQRDDFETTPSKSNKATRTVISISSDDEEPIHVPNKVASSSKKKTRPPITRSGAEESPGSVYLSSSSTLVQPPSPVTSESSLPRSTFPTPPPIRVIPTQEGDAQSSNIPGASSFMKNFFSANQLSHSIIAHDRNLQRLFDTKLIRWGVQWEVYRGLNSNRWTVEDVESHVDRLCGTHADIMPFVGRIFGKPDRIGVDAKLAAELDREHAALLEKKERGLGLMGAFEGVPDWYGGRVQFIVRLVQPATGQYRFEMEPPEMRKSTRLGRDLGSRRILHARIGEQPMRNDRDGIIKSLERKFIIGGRVFLALPPKEDSMYLVEDTEDFERFSRKEFGDDLRLSYGEVLDRYNPMALNVNQPLLKFFARYALAMSTSVPAIEFLDENIIFIEDDVAPDWTGPGKPPAEKTLTDGCGYMNKAALVVIALRFKFPFPTAVQGRIAGSKGLWILHPTDSSSIPKIWIRQSQLKVKLPRPLRRGERILDLVQTSSGQTVLPTMHLSMQSIMNLSHNGVPDEVFIKLSADGLNAAVGPLMDWRTPFALARLWQAVTHLGGVGGIRMSRMAAGLSRVLGYSGRPIGNPDAQASADPSEDQATASTRGDLDGAPLSAYEAVLELLQSGFNPGELPMLWSKLRQVVVWTINDAIEGYKIPLPDGTAGKAFAIADPFGRLQEDEIYYRVSGGFQDDMLRTKHVVTGEVLTGRYPIRHASDIQRVRAVDYPEYAEYSDVVIVPSKCSNRHAIDEFGLRSFMSILGGGDLDGDELFVIWEPSLVQPFSNKPMTTEPLDFKKNNFESSVEQVHQFMKRTEGTATAQQEFMQILLHGFSDSLVGRYSVYHDISIYIRGYDHKETTRLAFMSNTLLDAGKTGVRVNGAVRKKDFRQPMARPPCMDPHSMNASSTILSHCAQYGKEFVLEALQAAGKKFSNEMQVQYDKICGPKSQETKGEDLDLLAPYATLLHSDAPESILAALALVKVHVDASIKLWQLATSKSSPKTSVTFNGKQSFKSRAPTIELKKQKQSLYDEVAIHFHSPIEGISWLPNLETIKASYAYQTKPTFAFSVAFRELCKIKAEAAGLAPSTKMFDELRSSMPGAARRLLEQEISFVADPTI